MGFRLWIRSVGQYPKRSIRTFYLDHLNFNHIEPMPGARCIFCGIGGLITMYGQYVTPQKGSSVEPSDPIYHLVANEAFVPDLATSTFLTLRRAIPLSSSRFGSYLVYDLWGSFHRGLPCKCLTMVAIHL